MKDEPLTRKEARDSIKTNVENEKLVKHMLATEAIMRALARRPGEDKEEWGLTWLEGFLIKGEGGKFRYDN